MFRTKNIFKKIIVSITSFSLLFTSLYFTLPETASAAGGGLDTGFLANSQNLTGGNNLVATAVEQTDGKILVAGAFTSFNGTAINRIARLNADGSLDTTFNPGTGVNNNIVQKIIQLPDGKILIGGTFTSYNGTPRNRIARLNADGSLDTTFNPGTAANNGIVEITVQPDGKILIGGVFTSYNGTARNRIARLNADGSLDTTFNPGTGSDAFLWSIVHNADNTIVIGGEFTTFNGTPRARIARLNADGSLDTTFDPGTGSDGIVRSVVSQNDGKIVIAGAFTSFNGTPRARIARLNADGSLDTTFDPGTGVGGGSATIDTITRLSDGSIIIVGGNFTTFNTVPRGRIARVNTNGSLNTSFMTNKGAGGPTRRSIVQSDGKILVIGSFTSFGDIVQNRITRLNTDGSVDMTYNSGIGADNAIQNFASQPDGKILIAGLFTSYNGTARARIARLNTDGSLDTSFDPALGADGIVNQVSVEPGGRIIIVGDFTSYNGTARARIARLNTDGSLDTTFDPGLGGNGTVWFSNVQIDGKIIIVGEFTSFNGTSRARIARLNTDGSLDTTFDPGLGGDNFIYLSKIQPDGKILIGGEFTSYNSTPRNRIARLNTDGSLDTSFDPGLGAGGSRVVPITVQPDGKILIGGTFTTYNSTPRNRIARLNPDGSLDTTFDPGLGADNTTQAITLQPDGAILLGGSFTAYNGVPRGRFVRILNTADVTAPVLSSITLTSSNTTPTVATAGDIVTLSYTTDDMILSQIVTIGGVTVTPSCIPSFFYSSVCTATVPITDSTPVSDAPLLFSISMTSAGGTTTVTDTTDDSSVAVTRPTPPPAIISSGVILPSFLSQNTPPLPPESETSSETTPLQTQCFTTALGRRQRGNDPQKVKELQQFLNTHLSLAIPVIGVFGPQTERGVSLFQERYRAEILTPINLTRATGYFGQMSILQVNRIRGCQ